MFVALLLVATVLAGVARYVNVHYAIVLVFGGLVLGLIPGLSTPRIDPNVVLFIFLPPLIYAAAFGSSTQDLRAHAGSIGLLAVGLVLATMGAVAVVAHAVAGIRWGPAFVLGAILGPTDPIAATAILRRVGAPGRVSTILEGEALVNDATALTAYKVAVPRWCPATSRSARAFCISWGIRPAAWRSAWPRAGCRWRFDAGSTSRRSRSASRC